jgi:hydroxylaminobenzene mutase
VDLLLQVGLIELAIGALAGWLMVIREEKPDWLKRAGVVQQHRIRQLHLDFLMMGLILIAVGLVVSGPPPLLQGMLIFGTIVNPSLFVPLAFNPGVDQKLWFRGLSLVSFIAVSGGLVWAAILGP